jgi:hypothetical protein
MTKPSNSHLWERAPSRSFGFGLGGLLNCLVVTILVCLLGLPTLTLGRFSTRLTSQLLGGGSMAWWVFGGLVAGAFSFLVAKRNHRVAFLNTLQHELAHVGMAFLLGAVPRSLWAGLGSGGEIRYELRGPLRSARMFLIDVAPYWVSPFVAVPVLVALAFPPSPGPWLGALGWLLGVAVVLPLAQFHPRQTDLRKYFLIPPVGVALWLWMAVVVVALPATARGSLEPVLTTYAAGWETLVAFARAIG